MNDIFFSLFYFTYILVVFSTVVFVVLDNRNPVKAMAWILVLFFLPLVGLVLYFFLGRSNRKERLISKKGYSRLIKRPMAEYQAQETLNISTGKYRIISFFKNVNKALPFDGNEVEFLNSNHRLLTSTSAKIRHFCFTNQHSLHYLSFF